MHFEVGLPNRSKHLMQIVQYLKDKFNPSRPMGRKNFVWSYLLTICVYAPIAWNLPGMDEMPASATTILLLQLISTLKTYCSFDGLVLREFQQHL